MAESAMDGVKKETTKKKHIKAKIKCVKDTWHRKRLGEGVKGRAPGDLPRSNVRINKLQLIKELP